MYYFQVNKRSCVTRNMVSSWIGMNFFKNVWAFFICNESVFLHHRVLSSAKHFLFVAVMQTSFSAVFIFFCMFTNPNDVDAGQ